jgi:hypothetical protein
MLTSAITLRGWFEQSGVGELSFRRPEKCNHRTSSHHQSYSSHPSYSAFRYTNGVTALSPAVGTAVPVRKDFPRAYPGADAP